MTSQPVSLRVGGTWLATVAAWGEMEVKHGEHGPLEATWSMALRDNRRPTCLRRNTPVEVYAGAELCWSGVLSEPDWDGHQFAAIGISRLGEGALCLNGAGAVTSKPNTALDQAAARGVVNWVRSSDFGNSDIAGPEGGSGVDDPEPGSIDDLLDLRVEELDTQWYVHPDRRLVIRPAVESTPRWLILPGAGVLGVADDNVTDRVALRFLDSVSGQYRTAFYPAVTPAGGIERRASVTRSGPMTAARATSIAQGIYTKAQAGRTGWLNGVEVFAEQIRTFGGLRPNLARIRPGHTVRMLDVVDPRNGRGYLDFVIGDTAWRPAEKRIQINPVGLAAATFEEILADFNATEAA